MTTRTCLACDGNGYHYDNDRGEFTGFCPECDGTGFVESTFPDRTNSFHVELELEVSETARFHDEIRRKVESLGWGYDDYPVQSDYLLQLLVQFFSRLRPDGITMRSMSVGKRVVYVKTVDMGDNNQPTLF